jgi:hypothetical protein
MYERFICKDENFRSAYIVGNKIMRRDLETRTYITNNFFGRDFFSVHAHAICGLRYSDFYSNEDVMIPANMVVANTGIPLTEMMIQTLRGVCGVAKIKYSKKELGQRGCVDVRTFMLRSKRGSRRFRLLMASGGGTDVPHNINKYARNMDIIINGAQVEFLNSLWTNNFLNNNMKTFLFKLHNNTLGYNSAVAHFVRGHSPNFTFSDSAGDADINPETGLHLFFDCTHVSGVIDFIFSRVTTVENFVFSRHEFFATFDRKELSHSKNMASTILSKLIMKTLWDCKLRYSTPNGEVCWHFLKDEIISLKSTNRKFSKLWANSGFSP